MRRLLAFSLACLTAATAFAVFTVPAAAAGVSSVEVWKWKRVNSKSDVKAILNGSHNDVTVPVYLCWETPSGTSYVLQGTDNGAPYNKGKDGFIPFYRDGASVSLQTDSMPTDIVPYFKKYLQETYPDKVEEYGGIDVFYLMRGNSYIGNFYQDVVKSSKAAWATTPAAKRFFDGSVLFNKTSFLMMAGQGFPKGVSTSSEKGLFYGSETFYTDTNTSDITMTVRSSDLSVYFKCGKSCLVCSTFGLLDTTNFYVNNPGVSWWEVDPSKSFETVSFTLEPSDTKNDRAQFTDAGKLQLTHTITGQIGGFGGLCFDGSYVDMLIQDDKKPTFFSNFTLYYGVKSAVTELDGDYTVKKGETQNFNNNMIIGSGSHLVIEPGAVVTVTGMLQNQGTIENCGTLIVNENSAIVSSGGGTIKNYGSSVDIPSMYYRAKVSLATSEYEEKYAQLSHDWGYQYYNPMRSIESEIEEYSRLAEEYADIPQQKAIFEEIVEKYVGMKKDLLAKTAELREEYEYFKNNRDKIIRDSIAAYYKESLTMEGAEKEYEEKFAQISKRFNEEYTKPLVEIETELNRYESLTQEEIAKMSEEEYNELTANYMLKRAEKEKLLEETEELANEYVRYRRDREKIIEEIYLAHGGGSGETGETISYTDCSGELVVLKNGALLFNAANEPLGIYEGATFMNAGVAVLPRGFLVSYGEIQNKSTGHIFSGFYMKDTTFTGTTVSSPGTKDATLPNMVASANGSSRAGGNYYINNEGTIICHGGYTFENSDKNMSGLNKVFTR